LLKRLWLPLREFLPWLRVVYYWKAFNAPNHQYLAQIWPLSHLLKILLLISKITWNK
jgi:hypothetical protein